MGFNGVFAFDRFSRQSWGSGMVKIIDAEFEELEPEQKKKPAKKNKKWIREIFNFCACMLAALLFSMILGLFIYGK